jgi:fucose permease
MTTDTLTDAQAPAPHRPGYRFYVLAVLILIYMLNFLDRQIIGILAAPLKEEFGMSDSQFGLLGGIAFASVYSTLAIPLAWMADRFRRAGDPSPSASAGARPAGPAGRRR